MISNGFNMTQHSDMMGSGLSMHGAGGMPTQTMMNQGGLTDTSFLNMTQGMLPPIGQTTLNGTFTHQS